MNPSARWSTSPKESVMCPAWRSAPRRSSDVIGKAQRRGDSLSMLAAKEIQREDIHESVDEGSAGHRGHKTRRRERDETTRVGDLAVRFTRDAVDARVDAGTQSEPRMRLPLKSREEPRARTGERALKTRRADLQRRDGMEREGIFEEIVSKTDRGIPRTCPGLDFERETLTVPVDAGRGGHLKGRDHRKKVIGRKSAITKKDDAGAQLGVSERDDLLARKVGVGEMPMGERKVK